MQRGFCNHKDKNSRIVTEWKCVDIRFPDKITLAEKQQRESDCRKKDYYGVCELCKYFTPEPATPAGQPVVQTEKHAYTQTKDNLDGWLDDLI